MNTTPKRPTGFWPFSIIAMILTLLYLLGQTMAIIDYDFTVSIGLQEPVNEITKVGVALNKGFRMGDTIIYISFLILGITGLIKRTWWGLFSLIGSMAITLYWPLVALSTLYYAKGAPGFHFSDYSSYSILLSGIFIMVYGGSGFFTGKEINW